MDTILFSGKTLMRLAFAMLLVSCIPVFLVELPPITDLPNHLARGHILRMGDADPWLSGYYAASWGFIPNLLMDFIMVGLKAVPIFYVGKIIVLLYFCLLVAGVFLIRRSLFGSVGVLSLLIFLFLYNRMFLWGMLNYMLGVGLMLIAFGLWLEYRDKAVKKLIPLSVIMASLIFFTHVFPFGLYALCIGAYELQRVLENGYKKWENWFEPVKLGVWQFLFPVVTFLFLSPTVEFVQDSRIEFGDPLRKLTNSPFMLLNNYSLPLDVVSYALLGLAGLFLIWRRYITIDRRMYGVLGMLTAVHFLMPQYFLSSPGADLRTFLPLVFMFVASIRLTGLTSRHMHIALAGVLLLFTVRLGVVAWNWYQADKAVLPDYTALIEKLPIGAKVGNYYIVQSDQWFFNPPHNHYITLAIIDKSALVRSLFAHPGQQPVIIREPWRTRLVASQAPEKELSVSGTNIPVKPDMLGSAFYYCRFTEIDWFVLSNRRANSFEAPAFLELVYDSPATELYKVNHDAIKQMYLEPCL